MRSVARTGWREKKKTDLDRLVRPARDQPRPGHVKRRAKHARLCLERPRLRDVVHVLKRRARVIIPKRERAIIACKPLGQRSPHGGHHAPPEKKTPSGLTESVLMMALCPAKLKTKLPSGHFHFLILFPPAAPDANEYSVGWMARARTDFLWWVSVTMVFPAARSHRL